ncbi:MAG: TAT-variant-translocated molybdopterin oxidoreductase [Phycisphaerales bacterium]|nr:TAT-variant-translocated molybdopterin oxidoreductase [Phycisphaerales bacterium]
MHENQANNDSNPELTTGPVEETAATIPPHLKGRELWRSLEQLAETDEYRSFAEREFQKGASELEGEDRRQFLRVMGASLALAGLGTAACRRLPETKIAPYAQRPDDRIPGVPVEYATNFELGGVATGVLAKSFDGRPINIEGNARHPGSEGACGAMAQGTVLALYDPDRLRQLKHSGENADFAAFEKWMKERCATHGDGAGLAIMSGASSGPSMARMKAAFKKKFPSATWTEWEAVNDDNAYEGTKKAFRLPYRVRPDFATAEIVVSLGADFLCNEVNSKSNAANWVKLRNLQGKAADATMSRVYQFESMLTVTGMSSDERVSVRPSDMPALAAMLMARLTGSKLDVSALEKRLGDSANRSYTDEHGATVSVNDLEIFEKAASDLDDHRGRCLVVAGADQPPAVHAAAALLNQELANVGKTVRYTALEDRDTRTQAITSLTTELQSGAVKTLVLFDVDPVYTAPADLKFADAMGKVEEVVFVGTHGNQTSAGKNCNWVVPGTHYLEAWGDARGFEGTIGVVQPLIYPLVDRSQGGRSALELTAMMSGENTVDGLQIVRETAQKRYETSEFAFERQWRNALADGFEADTAWPLQNARAISADVVTSAVKDAMSSGGGTDDIELVLHHDGKVFDGRFGNVGWMQELPDPVSKLTWDNALMMGPALAQRLGLKSGDRVKVAASGATISAAAMVMPGYADNTCSLAIGYGQDASSGRIADGAGFDAYPLRTSGAMNLVRKVAITTEAGTYPLATTQDHGTIGSLIPEVPEAGIQERLPSLVRGASLDTYRKNPAFSKGAAHIAHSLSLWEESNLDGAKFRWAMSINLSTCTGCSSCVVACQAENNIPVVGKDQVLRGREMHWLRIDRYFKGGTASRPEQVVAQPVTCQQCENAPCEQVCPVAATVHDKDGLNVMVYNRCIGTRYCSNNCPYKVRRFNFFDYTRRDPIRKQEGLFAVSAEYYTRTGPNDWRRMQYNPDVTVRSRGVMEKCSFCVQRINAAKIKYKNAWAQQGGGANKEHPDWHIPDGVIVTACEQACATGSIVFGDLNDPNSRVSKLHADPRTYDLLGELNTKPRLKYMAMVTNPAAPLAVYDTGGHGGHGGHDDHGHDHDHDHASTATDVDSVEVRS